MLVDADFHIHGRYSTAVSDRMTFDTLAGEAPKKGIGLLGTGDCLHPGWRSAIDGMEKVEEGLYRQGDTFFVLTCEVEDTARVHHLLFFPSISAVEDFYRKASRYSRNMDSDGRPSLAMTGVDLGDLCSDLDILFGPAHAFTPWTALYASYDSLDTCYERHAKGVAFIELGLSADSDYADRIPGIRHLTFLTNSDAHSPYPVRLGREFNRLEIQEHGFEEVKKAILRQGGRRIVLNVGLPPAKGKYNRTACIRCHRRVSLRDAEAQRWRCASCRGRLKKGVFDRVLQLSDGEGTGHPSHRPPYLHLIPLAELIALALGRSTHNAKSVTRIWESMVSKYGSELKVLLDAPLDDMDDRWPGITATIGAFREGGIVVHPGGGGMYGKIALPHDIDPRENHGKSEKQRSLFDFQS